MAGILRTDTIQNSNTSTIITQTNSTTITIGTTGQTVALASGASQSGFGRAGSVNWDTTPKTTGFTAVSGNGYFVDTNTTAITVTLPATPAAGDIVAIADYANTSATNNITVGRNGSNIDGSTIDAKIKVNGQVYTLVYVDATEGWKTVGQTFNQITTAEFVAATGGTITTCGNFKIHTFTGPGTFTVTNAGNPSGSTTVDYLVVAAGGGGAGNQGGGGGAGGFRQSFPNPATAGFPITATAYPITVGSGGAGNPSIFSTITSTGGGNGGGRPASNAGSGGSGGGGGGCSPRPGGAGNTPPTSPSQGNPGGAGQQPDGGGGGGGGAAATGSNSVSPRSGGAGGNGSANSISGSPVTYAGGGGGGSGTGVGGAGGTGGGGSGGSGPPGILATNGGANTGGGAGGGGNDTPNIAGGTGGSGIVIIRYQYQ
jgi:hypothetical protein